MPSPHLSLKQARWAWHQAWITHRGLTVTIVALAIVRSLLPAAIALIGRGLIDALVAAINTGSNDMRSVLPWLAAGLGVGLLDALATNMTEYARQRLNDELAISVTTNLMQHLVSLKVAFFEQPSFQNTIELAYKHSAERLAAFVYQTLSVASTLLQAVSLLAILLAIEPAVSVVLLGLALPYLFYYSSFTKKRYQLERRRVGKRRWLNYYLGFVIHPERIPETKLLGLGSYFVNQCHEFLRDFRDENRRLSRIVVAGSGLFTLLSLVALYALLLHTAARAVAGGLTVGDVVIFVGAIGRLRSTLEQTARAYGDMRELMLYVDNLYQLLETQLQMPGRTQLGTSLSGSIRLNNVSFRYPEAENLTLKGISLEIESGAVIALVGENGAGKTTLAKLLARLYDPTDGAVLVDGKDLTEFSAESWHNQISYVFQNFNRYEATAAENIAYGNWRKLLDADEEHIANIARLAGAQQLIEDAPQGYQTKLGRRFGEHNLSTGQWQKIAIARAFARPDSKLIILDEPSAHLDAHAEYELFNRFRDLSDGRTTILISHRFSTVSMADRILVLKEGQLIEEGSHDDLLTRDGHYASLYQAQQKPYGHCQGS